MSHAKLEVRMESLLPFLQGTCTPYNIPVYPGAQCIIAISRELRMWKHKCEDVTSYENCQG